MFEQIGRLAEAAATKVSVSRRGFFGQLGRGALAAAGVLGGLLALPRDARANGDYVCCKYRCRTDGGYILPVYLCYPPGTTCNPSPDPQCKLKRQRTVSSCDTCR